MIAALILAGGASRRMGSPKALLPFPDRPLVQAHWLALRRAGVDPLRIVVGAHARRIATGSMLAQENFVVNRRHRLGQLSSLQAGLAALLADRSWPAVLVLPVDVLPPKQAVIDRLVARFEAGGADAVKPTFSGKGGHPVLLSRALCRRVLRLDGRTGRLDVVLRALEAEGRGARVPVRAPEVLANLNDPGAYEAALSRLKR